LIRAGELTPADLVWRDGMRDWQPCGQVAEFAPLMARREHTLPPVVADSPAASTARPGQIRPVGKVPNYLWQAIVVTILCCWPFGIPAIVYAAKVDDLAARGDMAGAVAASNNARTWCWVAFLVGLLPAALVVLWLVMVVLAGALFSAA
ncbi:MAG: CD225/dispanin family protein, partial [Akkermansiaceae bacterium]|nr:CD225/dispanin family protein [Akkermansiaceae bacterium]